MYCKHCRQVMDNDFCPDCRKATRMPEADDICFLAERSHPWSDILCDVLKQEGIPFLRQSNLGHGLMSMIGQGLELESIYVNWKDWERAVDVAAGLFSEEVEILWDEEDELQE